MTDNTTTPSCHAIAASRTYGRSRWMAHCHPRWPLPTRVHSVHTRHTARVISAATVHLDDPMAMLKIGLLTAASIEVTSSARLQPGFLHVRVPRPPLEEPPVQPCPQLRVRCVPGCRTGVPMPSGFSLHSPRRSEDALHLVYQFLRQPQSISGFLLRPVAPSNTVGCFVASSEQ